MFTNRLAQAWGRAQAAVAAHSAISFGELDITMPQLRLLGLLVRSRYMSGRQLAQALGVTPSSVVPLVDRLETRGYVRRVAGIDRRAGNRGDRRDDRRITWVEITDSGDEAFRTLWVPRMETIQGATAEFTEEESRSFELLLNRLADILEGPDHTATRD